MLFYTSPVAYFSLNCTETCSEHPRDTKETYHYCAFVFFQSRRALETEPLLHRTPPLARSPPQAGRLSVSPTRFSGRCTSSSLLLSWRSAFSFGFIFSSIYSVVCWVPLLSLLSCVFRYNVVFRYLLSVRRVQSQLQHCWALQMQRKHLKSSQTDAVKWRLRNHMAFLIDNLQYYLQVIKVKEAPHV